MARSKPCSHEELINLVNQFGNSDQSDSEHDLDFDDSSEDDYCVSTMSSSSSDDEDAVSIQQPRGRGRGQNKNAQQLPIPGPSSCTAQWKANFSKRNKVDFSGTSGLQKRLTQPNILPIMIFDQLFDKEIIEIMVIETNRYAEQHLANQRLSRTARMTRWHNVTDNEIRKFLGVIILTGLIRFPKMEDYWKQDPLFLHPLFHHIDMSYNRFSLILKNWHFTNNATIDPNNRLYKISTIMNKVIANIQELYTPGEEVSIDETMISHHGRLVFRQYNPMKAHRYGIKIFKLCDMSGYVWNASIYCGKGSSDKRPGLDHAGSVILDLGESLLDKGRLFVADNWYSSIELANFLKTRNTEYCGTVRKNRKNLPTTVTAAKIKKGEAIGAINQNSIRVIKYKDKKDVNMISTFHGTDFSETGKRNRANDTVTKPTVVIDYNRVKGGIDLSDQMIEYYSPARKSVKWYRKVIFQLISIGVLNSWVIYNKYYKTSARNKIPLVDFTKSVAQSLLGKAEGYNEIHPLQAQAHKLTKIPKTVDNKVIRKRCIVCYDNISKNTDRKEAQKKCPQVATECISCKKPLCINCFNATHNMNVN